MHLAAVICRTFDSKPSCSTLKATATALRRFDEGEKVNFLFALYGPKLLLMEPEPFPIFEEDPEEESVSEDEEINPWMELSWRWYWRMLYLKLHKKSISDYKSWSWQSFFVFCGTWLPWKRVAWWSSRRTAKAALKVWNIGHHRRLGRWLDWMWLVAIQTDNRQTAKIKLQKGVQSGVGLGKGWWTDEQSGPFFF